jgi:hypothetical protein
MKTYLKRRLADVGEAAWGGYGPSGQHNEHNVPSYGPLDATLDRLMMQSEPASHRKKRWVVSISQQYPRPLHPACRFGSRLRYRPQVRTVLISERQLDRPPPGGHGFQPLVPNLLVHIWGLQMNPFLLTTFMESIV